MQNLDYTKTLSVSASPTEAFNAIRDVRGWWSGLYAEEIEGKAGRLNDEFTFRAGGGAHYSKQQLVELVPDKKITWLVTDSKLSFLSDQAEWTGSKIMFEIMKAGDTTNIVFTHSGLVPGIECYQECSNAWGRYLQMLQQKLS